MQISKFLILTKTNGNLSYGRPRGDIIAIEKSTVNETWTNLGSLSQTSSINQKWMLFPTHLSAVIDQLMAMRMLLMTSTVNLWILTLNWLQKFLLVLETLTHSSHDHLMVHSTRSIPVKLISYLFATTLR